MTGVSWIFQIVVGFLELLMEWLLDPAAWVGLLTLVVLEIVLGIDNLIFIAILADKLPLRSATARASWG